jgi:preprotein translocase subunit SecD
MSKIIASIKSYWRIYILVAFTVLSLGVILSPAISGIVDTSDNAGMESSGDDELSSSDDINQTNQEVEVVEDDAITSLRYDIELGGGTRIRAPLIGLTANDADIGDRDPEELESAISEEFSNTTEEDVRVRVGEERESTNATSVEVTTGEPTEESFADALSTNGVEYNSIKTGVTPETRQQAVEVLQSKIDQVGLSGGSVREVELRNGRNLILVEVPDISRQQTVDLLTERGEVHVDIYYPNETTGEYQTESGVLVREDFRTIGNPQQGQNVLGPHVPVTLESDAATQFAEQTTETGVAQVGGSSCTYDLDRSSTEACLLTKVDGEVVYSAGMDGDLAGQIRSGTWEKDPNFILSTTNFSEAQELSVNLKAGAPPAPLDISEGEVSFVAPEQGQQFRVIALLIGILSTLAVALSVSLRYGKPRVAVPMIITASSEVIILLAIASVLNYPIDVAVIAGLIAVIGTGVDDLIIITDRVLGDKGNTSTSTRIFNNRFRSALWIILSAAGTTILALGPLAVLQLRQLQGFAIFTIIGVIAGVLLTRPSYGDMLRYFFTDK